jgi:outer membrane protein OmpA-like peptidoglycan-associated protein
MNSKDLTMTYQRTLNIKLLALATAAMLAGCNTVPPGNVQLNDARADYRKALDNQQTRDLAGSELAWAGEALRKANEASERRDRPEDVDHLAYLAGHWVAIAEESGKQRAAERAVSAADMARDQVRLVARTEEADAAQRTADAATLESQESQRQAALSQSRNQALEAQLKALNAKQTNRGLVVTFGDVFFDTNQARLKANGMQEVDKLASFLKSFPQRRAMVEGYTDSVGSEGHNQALSERRADAVQHALVTRGVDTARLSTRGYGEAYAVAENDSAGGRQLNRRVEIVLSDEGGVIAPR